RLAPGNSHAYLLRGAAHLLASDADKAVADITHALRIDPDYVLAHAVLASAHAARGDYGLAQVECARALLRDPECESALLTRGQAYLLQTEESKPGASRARKPDEVRRIAWDGVEVSSSFSPDGQLYLGGGDNGKLRAWETTSGKQVADIPVAAGVITADGKHL